MDSMVQGTQKWRLGEERTGAKANGIIQKNKVNTTPCINQKISGHKHQNKIILSHCVAGCVCTVKAFVNKKSTQ